MDINTIINLINSSITSNRKSGVQNLLEMIKNYYYDSNDVSNQPDKLFTSKYQLDELFLSFGNLLRDDSEWTIQRDTIEVLIAIITKDLLSNKLDDYIQSIFRYLMPCFAASKMTVRKSSNQCFHEYLKKSRNFEKAISNFVELAFNKDVPFSSRRDYNQTLLIVLTINFANKNFENILKGVLQQLEIDRNDEKLFDLVFEVVKNIKKIFGEEKLMRTVKNLSQPVQNLFFDFCFIHLDSNVSSHVNSKAATPVSRNASENGYNTTMGVFPNKSLSLNSSSSSPKIFCGFIPENVMFNLQGEKKLEATEELICILNKSVMDISQIVPHLNELLDITNRLMEDKYNVIIKALQFIIDLVNKLPNEVVDDYQDRLLQLLRTCLANNMNTDAIMQKLMATYSMLLFHKSNLKQLIQRLCNGNFLNEPKLSSIRQMSINIIITALLKFPSTMFDLNFITAKIAERLVDKKTKVKQAALECLSVIGYIHGQAKLTVLMKAIESSVVPLIASLQTAETCEHIRETVQLRLSYHKLPHLNDEGVVVYAALPDYINGSGATGSNSSHTSQYRNNSLTDIDNSSSDNSPISSANIMEKRRPSGGIVRGRTKLPWDQNDSTPSSTARQPPYSKQSSNHSTSSGAPPNDSSMQFSAAPLSTVINDSSLGRNIRKFAELNTPLDSEGFKPVSNNKFTGGTGGLATQRSDISEKNSTNGSSSVFTSGYSSGANTSRQYSNVVIYNKPIQPQQQVTASSPSNKSDDCPTATNSTNVTPRNNPQSTTTGAVSHRFEDTGKLTTSDFNSPIPTKPALGRSAGSRRMSSGNPLPGNTAIDNKTSKSQSTLPYETVPNPPNKSSTPPGSTVENSNTEEPIKLEQIRNSASKKKVQKIFNSNSMNNSDSFKSSQKPVIADSNHFSQNNSKNPTFKPNNNYSGMVTGRSVGIESPIQSTLDNKQKRLPVKGLLESNSPISGNNTQRNISINDQKNKQSKSFNNSTPNSKLVTNPTRKSDNYSKQPIGIIGVGLNDNKHPNDHDFTTANDDSYSDDFATSPHELFDEDDDDDDDDDEEVDFINEDSDDEPNKNLISNTLRNSMSLKKLKVSNGSQKENPELTNNHQHNHKSTMGNKPQVTPGTLSGVTNSSHSAPGSGSHPISNRKPPVSNFYNNSIASSASSTAQPNSAGNQRDQKNDTVPPSRRPLKPAYANTSSTPKKNKPNSQMTSAAVNPLIDGSASSAASAISEPAPLPNPERTILQCQQNIQHEDWEDKIEALNDIQSLAIFHTDLIVSRPTELHSICLALCKEIKNLRSQVARAGINTAGQLFKSLKRTMDQEVELLVASLFAKAGDPTSSFIRQDVENNLQLMIENVSPQRAITSLINNGLDNKNAALRRLSAINLMMLCEKLTYQKVFAIMKENNDRLLMAVIKFAMDGNGDTRYYAKRMISELMKNPEFEKLFNKHIPPNDLRNVKNIIESIKTKGIGDPPQISHSAGLGRSGSMSRGGSAGNLITMGTVPHVGSSTTPATKLSRGGSRSMTKLPTASAGSTSSGNYPSMPPDSSTESWLNSLCTQLASNDFRQRILGLEALQDQLDMSGETLEVSGNSVYLHNVAINSKLLTRLLQQLMPKLTDNNSKVTICALNVTRKLIPCISATLPNEHLPRLMHSISNNFSSKSIEVKDSAYALMAICFECLDPILLIQPCIESINNSNCKTKPILIDNLTSQLKSEYSLSPSNNNSSARLTNAITRYIVPFANLLFEQHNKALPQAIRQSLQHLIRLSHDIVGPELLDYAVQRGGQSLKQQILELLK